MPPPVGRRGSNSYLQDAYSRTTDKESWIESLGNDDRETERKALQAKIDGKSNLVNENGIIDGNPGGPSPGSTMSTTAIPGIIGPGPVRSTWTAASSANQGGNINSNINYNSSNINAAAGTTRFTGGTGGGPPATSPRRLSAALAAGAYASLGNNQNASQQSNGGAGGSSEGQGPGQQQGNNSNSNNNNNTSDSNTGNSTSAPGTGPIERMSYSQNKRGSDQNLMDIQSILDGSKDIMRQRNTFGAPAYSNVGRPSFILDGITDNGGPLQNISRRQQSQSGGGGGDLTPRRMSANAVMTPRRMSAGGHMQSNTVAGGSGGNTGNTTGGAGLGAGSGQGSTSQNQSQQNRTSWVNNSAASNSNTSNTVTVMNNDQNKTQSTSANIDPQTPPPTAGKRTEDRDGPLTNENNNNNNNSISNTGTGPGNSNTNDSQQNQKSSSFKESSGPSPTTPTLPAIQGASLYQNPSDQQSRPNTGPAILSSQSTNSNSGQGAGSQGQGNTTSIDTIMDRVRRRSYGEIAPQFGTQQQNQQSESEQNNVVQSESNTPPNTMSNQTTPRTVGINVNGIVTSKNGNYFAEPAGPGNSNSNNNDEGLPVFGQMSVGGALGGPRRMSLPLQVGTKLGVLPESNRGSFAETNQQESNNANGNGLTPTSPTSTKTGSPGSPDSPNNNSSMGPRSRRLQGRLPAAANNNKMNKSLSGPEAGPGNTNVNDDPDLPSEQDIDTIRGPSPQHPQMDNHHNSSNSSSNNQRMIVVNPQRNTFAATSQKEKERMNDNQYGPGTNSAYNYMNDYYNSPGDPLFLNDEQEYNNNDGPQEEKFVTLDDLEKQAAAMAALEDEAALQALGSKACRTTFVGDSRDQERFRNHQFLKNPSSRKHGSESEVVGIDDGVLEDERDNAILAEADYPAVAIGTGQYANRSFHGRLEDAIERIGERSTAQNNQQRGSIGAGGVQNQGPGGGVPGGKNTVSSDNNNNLNNNNNSSSTPRRGSINDRPSTGPASGGSDMQNDKSLKISKTQAVQAQVQLWTIISGQIVAGVSSETGFTLPLNRNNASQISSWFRKLQNTYRNNPSNNQSGPTMRWSDILNYYFTNKNALVSVLKVNLKKHYAAMSFGNTIYMDEPASVEQFFSILWPTEASKHSGQIKQWLLQFELSEFNKRIKVKPPPILPQEKSEELDAMFQCVLEDVKSKGPTKDKDDKTNKSLSDAEDGIDKDTLNNQNVPSDALLFKQIIEANVLSEEEIQRATDGSLFMSIIEPDTIITKEMFRNIACPLGYRGSENATRCVGKDGEELLLDPELGWIRKS